MKKKLLLLFLIFSFEVFSQTNERTIQILDSDTNLPVENAIVLILKTKQVLMTNADGKASFVLKGGSNLQISHFSYSTAAVKWATLKLGENIVYLKSKLVVLDAIIVTKEHPQNILISLVENSIKKLSIPARLKVYSREFFKLNGVYSYYNDGLINFQLVKNKKKIYSTLLVEQNRSFGLVEEEVSSDLLGYNLNDIMENYYSFKYLKPLLESKAKKEYFFTIKSCSIDDAFYEISATPLETLEGFRDDFKIIYDTQKKIITEISTEISPYTLSKAKEKTGDYSKNVVKSEFKATYRVDGANYYLLSSKENISLESVIKNQKKSIEVRNYLVTTNFNNLNFTYKESDVFKDKTLFNKKNSILTSYWFYSGLTPTAEDQAIISIIEKNIDH
jgi:hypothetical protein